MKHPSTQQTFFLIAIAVALSAMAISPVLVCSGEFYKWTDEKGVTYFSDSIANIPPEYRDQVKTGTLQKKKTRSISSKNKKVKDSLPQQSEQKEKQKTHRIPFTAYEGSARRIIVPVTINGSVTAPLAIDTGSPGMIISFELADKLGLFNKKVGKLQITAAGIGGSTPAIRTIIDTVHIGKATDEFIPTIITSSVSDKFHGLIGMDFMSKYTINIDNIKNVLILKEVPLKKNMPGGHDENWWRTLFKEFRSSRNSWKNYLNTIKKQVRESKFNLDLTESNLKKSELLAKQQYEESKKLLRKLEQYASRNSVPITWRSY